MRIVLAGLLFALLAPPVLAQSFTGAPLPVSISNVPDLWHADVLSSASAVSLDGADRAVRSLLPTAAKSSGASGKLIRAVELVGFDFPVATFFVILDHEMGHQFRASELNIPSRLRLVGSPWSVHAFRLEPDLRFYPMYRGPSLFDLGMESGGLEAVWLLKDRVEARVVRQGSIPFGDAVTLLVAATHTPVYAVSGKGNLRDVGAAPQGDITNYVYQVNSLRWRAGQPDNLDATVRAKSLLNLIDFSLWSDAAGVLTWLARGSESRPQSWLRIGPVGFIPALRYSLTPIGPEFSVRSHVRVGRTRASGYVRWSEPIGSARQKGAGITYFAPAFHGLEPTIQFDAWSHSVSGRGARGEVSVTTPGWPDRHVAVSATFGAKSSGYLGGYPLARSTYAVVGLNITLGSR